MRVITLTIAVVALGLFTPPAEAGCWCGWRYCLGAAAWTTDPGTVVTTDTYGVGSTSARNIGSCPYEGATPPTKVCTASAMWTTVKKAEVTGSISAENWGVSATVDQTLEVEVKCGGPVTISSWCSCCKTRARGKYKHTYACGTCACEDFLGGQAWTCSDYYCGTLTEYVGVECDEPGCTVPSDCTPQCPST